MAAMTIAPAPVREPAWSLPRSAIALWVTEGLIGVAVTVLVVGALFIWVPDDLGGPVPFLRWAVPVLAVLDALVELFVRPRLKHRVYRWEVTEDAVFTRTGWLSQTWTLVPVSRIQTVDVTRGLLQQLFGLATVAVFTASSQGTVRIWHLEHGMAQRVADDLAARAERTRDQAT
jgi:membrane protein YdbS with pleckstrin-like domain